MSINYTYVLLIFLIISFIVLGVSLEYKNTIGEIVGTIILTITCLSIAIFGKRKPTD